MEESEKLSVTRIRNKGERWVDAHETFVNGGENLVEIEDSEVDTTTTWEIVEWDYVREQVAKKILETEVMGISDDKKEKYEEETISNWDHFYTEKKQNFFKNRSYISKEFSELSGVGSINCLNPVVMEVGCGVGNTLFPLLKINTDKFFYAFDCSPTAIELLKKNSEFDPKRCSAFVLDICKEDLVGKIPENSVDISLMIFILSACPPQYMSSILEKIYKVTKPGGIIIIRDYGIYDMTQMRFFAKKTPNKMGENYYRRGDGTFSYFFEKEKADKMFSDIGFELIESKYDTRMLQNRKRKLKMYRVWFTGKYKKKS
jgi:SAM-dependent methyltransferase